MARAPRSGLGPRVALAAGVLVLGVLLLEGALSLAGARTLREVLRGGPAGPATFSTGEAAGDDASRGWFVVSTDPYVSYRLREDVDEPDVWGATLHTDELGLRVRPGPPPEPGAQRICVLGDSVAFGLGVGEEDTIGHHLEELLAGAVAEGTPRPVVTTVACPGWNIDNSSRFFLDHLDRLRPDVTLFVPVNNDLDTTSSATDRGHLYVSRWPNEDGSIPPIVSYSASFVLHASLRARVPEEDLRRYGAGFYNLQLHSGVTRESRRRYRHMASRLVELDARLRGLGGHLAVAPLEQELFQERLVQFLGELPGGPPVLGVFRSIREEDRLPDNAHFNGRFNRAAAWRMAEWLLERGWVRGGDRERLGPEDPDYVGNRADFPEGAALAERRREMDALAAPLFRPRIDLASGEGCNQIYGGVRADGVVGTSFLAALGGDGDLLRLRLARVPEVRGLYPLRLGVHVNGEPVAEREVLAGPEGDLTLEVRVPPALAGAPFLDVLVTASNWAHDRYQGVERQRSVVFRSLERVGAGD